MNNKIVEKNKSIIYNKDTSPALLMESIFELMNEGSLDSKLILFDIARNHNCELIRHETIFAIGEMGSDEEIRNFLKDTLKIDSSIVVRHEALVVLGLIGFQEDINFLKDFVNHEDIEISQSAKIGIQRIEQEFDFEKEVLLNQDRYRLELLNYSNLENDRIQIIFQLMKEGSKENIESIYKSFMNDPCPIVRHEAAFALGEIDNTLALKLLKVGILKQDYSIAIHEALFALGTTGRDEALETINQFIDNESYIVSQSAVIGFEKIKLVKDPYRGI